MRKQEAKCSGSVHPLLSIRVDAVDLDDRRTLSEVRGDDHLWADVSSILDGT